MKNSQPDVSVVIPVYNAEKYLTKTVQSLLNQSLSNMELILVDDGSSDASFDICDKFSKSDYRIHTIHQQNNGAGYARNAGLAAAKGKYVYFMDADDYIDDNLLKDNISLAYKYNADIVLFGLYIEKKDKNENIISRTEWVCSLEGLFTKEELTGKYFYDFFKTRTLSHCTRLYKRSFIEKYSFLFGNEPLGEDRLFVLQAERAESFNMYINRKPYYHYVQHNVSAIRKYYKEGHAVYSLKIAKKFEKIAKDGKVEDKKSLGLVNLRYAEAVLYELQNITNINSPLTKKEKMDVIKKLMSDTRIKYAIDNVPLNEINGKFSRLTALLLRMRAYNGVFILKKFW